MNCTKNTTPGHLCAQQQCIMAYVNAACAGRVTIFSTGGKVRPGSNFTQLHTLTLAARSYALLQLGS